VTGNDGMRLSYRLLAFHDFDALALMPGLADMTEQVSARQCNTQVGSMLVNSTGGTWCLSLFQVGEFQKLS
jgi:hypothetical protein